MASAVLRMFLAYVLVETGAVAALIWVVGFGWTVLGLLVAFVAGLALSAGQVRHQVRRLRSGAGRGALTDGGLVAAGALLVAVPGPVTTLLGLGLLAPATRSAARPLLVSAATIGLGRYTPLLSAAAVGRRWYAGRRAARRDDYIDAEVVSVVEVNQPALSAG